jgi:hypothetical protein
MEFFIVNWLHCVGVGASVINISYNRWIWGLLLLIFHIIGGYGGYCY